MAEYIEREAVLMYAKMFVHIAYNRSNPLRDEEIEKAVNEIPAADVVPGSDFRDCRNELCLRCGQYKTKHLGFCDGCRWRH